MDYLDQVELCLATFDSISYVQEGSAICGVITLVSGLCRSSLTDPILTNYSLMSDPILLLTKLRDIAFNKCIRKKPAQVDRPATAMSTNSKTRVCTASSSSSQHQVPAFAAITTAQCLLTGLLNVPAVLDSGASHHMLNDLEYFLDPEVCSIPISTAQNFTNLTAICAGTALISQSNGRTLELSNSLFVPGLSCNLLSLTQLVKQSASITRSAHHFH
ncbi:hypothetical protein PCANC_28911, partial [Puccinia coronata f. sp. avenae]